MASHTGHSAHGTDHTDIRWGDAHKAKWRIHDHKPAASDCEKEYEDVTSPFYGTGYGIEGERLPGAMKEFTAWDVYNNESKKVDDELVKDWTVSLNFLLVFVRPVSLITM